MSRWDSAAIVPNTSELLPEPDTPVNAVNRRFGRSTLMSWRLLTRAPTTRIRSWRSASCRVVLLATARWWHEAPVTAAGRGAARCGRLHLTVPVDGDPLHIGLRSDPLEAGVAEDEPRGGIGVDDPEVHADHRQARHAAPRGLAGARVDDVRASLIGGGGGKREVAGRLDDPGEAVGVRRCAEP